jgi:hypothetical protein
VREKEEILDSTSFQELLQSGDAQWLDSDAKHKDAKLLGIRSEQARALWPCKAKTFTPKALYDECEWLLTIIEQHKSDRVTWVRPISHIVMRPPDLKAVCDACTSWGVGGHSWSLRYYYQISWFDIDPVIWLWLTNRIGPGKFEGDLDINVLEYVGFVLTFAAAIVASQDPEFAFGYPPVILISGDNKAANRWATGHIKSDSPVARAVAKIICCLLRSSKISLKTEHRQGILNTFADKLSRDDIQNWIDAYKSANTSDLRLDLQVPESSTQTRSLRRFHPSPDLLRALSTCIKTPNTVDFQKLNLRNLGHLSHDSNISFDLS